jgi:hypothetical protein
MLYNTFRVNGISIEYIRQKKSVNNGKYIKEKEELIK